MSRYREFPSYLPSKDHPCPMLLNFCVQMWTGVSNMAWSAKKIVLQLTKCFSSTQPFWTSSELLLGQRVTMKPNVILFTFLTVQYFFRQCLLHDQLWPIVFELVWVWEVAKNGSPRHESFLIGFPLRVLSLDQWADPKFHSCKERDEKYFVLIDGLGNLSSHV